jgi:hypothetical protein
LVGLTCVPGVTISQLTLHTNTFAYVTATSNLQLINGITLNFICTDRLTNKKFMDPGYLYHFTIHSAVHEQCTIKYVPPFPHLAKI